MIKNKKHIIVIAIFLVVALIFFGFFGVVVFASYDRYIDKAKLEGLQINNISNLMIVAHPDDESLWAGAQLVKEDYFVVCLMYGKDDIRSVEFAKAMELSNDKFVMLNYNKSANGFPLSQGQVKRLAKKDFADIINCKDWNKILTHNAEGEYGHQRHKLVHQLVTQICQASNKTAALNYFGKFYPADNFDAVSPLLPTLDDDTYAKKLALLDIYQSQWQISLIKYLHMARYEVITPYAKPTD